MVTEANLFDLTRALQQTTARILAERSRGPGGISPSPSVPVVAVQLAPSALETDLLLTFHDQFGIETWLALPLELARKLAERLPEQVAKLESAPKTPRQ